MKKEVVQLKTSRWIYVLLSMLLMVIYGTVYSWGVFRIPVEDIYGIGTTSSGLPYMTFLLVYAMSMLIGGKMIERYAPRTLLIVGGIFISAGWILSSFTTEILTLTLSYGVIIGFGVGISYGVPIYVLALWFKEKKGMIIGIVLAGFGLSPLFTAPLGHWFIHNIGLEKTFFYYGIIFGILIILLSLFIKIPIVDNDKSKLSKANHNHGIHMIRSKSFKFAYICFFIGTLIGLTIIGLSSNVARDLIGLSPQKTALFMTVFAIFNGSGRPLFGWMTEKYGPQISMKISYVLIGISSMGMLFAGEGTVVLYVVLFGVLWLNLGAWLAIAPMMTMSLYGMTSYSKNYGLMFTAYGFGAVVGVMSTGLLIDLLKNYKLIFMLMIILAFIGYILSSKVVQDELSNE